MKLKHIFFATLALILTATSAVYSSAVYSQVGIEEKAKAAQAKPITVTCPNTLQIGPVSVPDGWQSLGSLPRPRLEIKVDAQTQTIVCEYGPKESLFYTYFISKKIPAGFDCEIPGPEAFQAVCTRKTKLRPGER